jgi:hypothetical protein
VAPYNLLSDNFVYKTITADIITALNNKGYALTVSGLYLLANDALANVDGIVGSEGGATLASINAVVDAINNAFDKCRIFVGYDVAPCAPFNPPAITRISGVTEGSTVNQLSVSAFPNPYNDKVRFEIKSPISGRGSLEVYNSLGQKMETVYKGYIFAGRGEIVEYKVPAINRTNLIYVLKVGSQQVAGKLLHIE